MKTNKIIQTGQQLKKGFGNAKAKVLTTLNKPKNIK